MEESFTCFDRIPEDIIMEILSRLPVKSLLRFKSVSKYWYILIRSPSFIAQHFSHKNNISIPFLHLYFLNSKELLSSATTQIQDSYIYKSTCLKPVIGPLNGLFFLHNLDLNEMAIWNPATKETKKISISSPRFGTNFKAYAHHLGFGMDPLSQDYKVVWIRDYLNKETFTRIGSAVVSVYSLSTNSWRHFEDNTFWSSYVVMSYFETYLDGFYYWKMVDGEGVCKILGFDMSNESFQVIQTPQVFNDNIGTLGLYDGSLSMMFHYNTCIEIWVMGKLGIWTKRVVLDSPLVVMRPIGYGINGEIFVESTTSSLAMIDPRTQEVKCLGSCGNGYSLQVLAYKKSLVSIKNLSSDNLEKKKHSPTYETSRDCNVRGRVTPIKVSNVYSLSCLSD